MWRQQVGGVYISNAVWGFQQEVTLLQAYMHEDYRFSDVMPAEACSLFMCGDSRNTAQDQQ
jgi:hypothetical protein